jgi:hypothetical protein
VKACPITMKTIPLKIVEVIMNDKPVNLSYRAQLIEIMKSPMDGRSAGIDEVRASIRVLDALNDTQIQSVNSLTLEDADFEYMAQKVKQARWPVVDKYVISFVEDVTKG